MIRSESYIYKYICIYIYNYILNLHCNVRQDDCAPFHTRNNIVLVLILILILYGLCYLLFFNECLGEFLNLPFVAWVSLTCSRSSNVAQRFRCRFRGKTHKVSFLIEINFSCAAIENFMHHLYSGSSFEICEKFQS